MKRYIRSATIQYDAESGMYRDNVDHYDTLEDFFFNSAIRKLGSRNGVEYGLSGRRRSRGRSNNSNAGWIGYKIDNGVVYITRFSPQGLETAEKWLREAFRDPNYDWIEVGRL